MSLEVGVAWALALVFGALSAIHVYWAMGGKRGLSSVLPATATTTTTGSRPLFQPGFVATATVALALALASLIVLWRAALIRPPRATLDSRGGRVGIGRSVPGARAGGTSVCGLVQAREGYAVRPHGHLAVQPPVSVGFHSVFRLGAFWSYASGSLSVGRSNSALLP